ncbi:class I SAM-dependent methyltransferase [Paenibacillus puldeungensis]|uniref:Class I SAM-dependent methyltransferase n=1 Tax=Paenibacillus puldeungensis TaxID=696536 RepID=A0ABW3RY74_9BACL
MNEGLVWKPELYDDKMAFVSEYGKEVVNLLQPKAGERIIDLGCGTGDLTVEISRSGAEVTGIDLSKPMIDKARTKYPSLHFAVGDAEQLHPTRPVHAVFSNAALHWMKNAAKVAESVWNVLEPGGRFVAEFGGKGNVEGIVNSITQVLKEEGIDADQLNPWYFPSLGEYSSLLEQQGFRVVYAVHFDRLTKLEGGERALDHWLDTFTDGNFFYGLNDQVKNDLYRRISDVARKQLFDDGCWYGDFKRLRIAAIKPIPRVD